MKKSALNIKIFLPVLVLVSLVIPSFVNSATFFTDGDNREVKVGDTFSVLVNTNSQGVAINAASVDMKFDTSFLSAQSVGRSGSIFTLWAEEPSYSNSRGIVTFSGGLASPGWSGTNGSLIRVTFKAKTIGQTKLTFENGSILANDGMGTNVLSGVRNLNVNIIAAAVVPPKPTPTPTPVPKPVPPTEPTATSTIVEPAPLTIPVLSNIPDSLITGDKLTFDGLGMSNGQTQVYIQKGKKNADITQVDTKADGKFKIAYKGSVSSGYYKIWARNISSSGVLSTSSDISYVEVSDKMTINILGMEIAYMTLIITLFIISIILLILFVLFIWLFMICRRSKKDKRNKDSNKGNDDEDRGGKNDRNERNDKGDRSDKSERNDKAENDKNDKANSHDAHDTHESHNNGDNKNDKYSNANHSDVAPKIITPNSVN